MLANFKLRLLLVIVLAAILGLIMQSNSPGKQAVEPVLRYIMKSDYDLLPTFYHFIPQRSWQRAEQIPASARLLLKAPCDFLAVEQNFGSYWNAAQNRPTFNPGMLFKVAANTPIKAVLPGTVQTIVRDSRAYTVKIKHSSGLQSIYGGLQEVEVQADHPVLLEQVIGKSSEKFYFELRSQEDPINPRSIFE